jgi:hypothetical protein
LVSVPLLVLLTLLALIWPIPWRAITGVGLVVPLLLLTFVAGAVLILR